MVKMMETAWLVVMAAAAIAIAGCDPTSFKDCVISCNAESGCPGGFTCGAEGLCRAEGVTATCDTVLQDAADSSCVCAGADTLSCSSGMTTCALGCVDEASRPARCRAVAASNGLQPSRLPSIDREIVINGGTATFNTDTGLITGVLARDAGTGAEAGIAFEAASSAPIGVFTFHRLAVGVTGRIRFTGSRAAAFLVKTTATINGEIDGSGGCYGTDTSCPGPGGGAGFNTTPAAGCGPGGAGTVTLNGGDTGGGGGGGRLAGARGGAYLTDLGAGAGGIACISATAEPLVGGSGGGPGSPGGALTPARGGGGGGAFQLTALERIEIAGTINMGGAGGAGGLPNATDAGGGSGGGAGGAILLEAPAVIVTGIIAANGGGGGSGGQTTSAGGDGAPGAASATPAPGGTPPSTTAGGGGRGGAGTTAPANGAGSTSAADNSGGGGGSVGTIFLRTASSPSVTGAIISPPPGTDQIRIE